MRNKILIIISGFSDQGVGEQFLHSMLKNYPNQDVFRYSFVQSDTVNCTRPYSVKTRIVDSSSLPLVSMIKVRRFIQKRLVSNVSEISELIDKRGIDTVWLFTNSIYNILVGKELVNKISIPLVMQVWDSPEYILKKNYIFGSLKKKILSAFGHMASKSAKGFTVTDFMSKEYGDKYGLDSEPMVFSPPAAIDLLPKSVVDTKKIEVVFAGSLYAYKEWSAFLNAVESHNERNNTTKISVRCIGNVSRWVKKRVWVKYEDLKPQKEAAELINQADIAYLPYWMSKKYSHFVKTAFPGKMSFYTSSGTPVFFHGPIDSSPSIFLEKFQIGLSCNSRDQQDIVNTIFSLKESDFRMKYVKERKRAMDTIFHPDRSNKLFLETIQSI